MRDQAASHWLGRNVINPHLSRYLPRVFTGEGSARRYEPWLLEQLSVAAAREPGVDALAIRDR